MSGADAAAQFELKVVDRDRRHAGHQPVLVGLRELHEAISHGVGILEGDDLVVVQEREDLRLEAPRARARSTRSRQLDVWAADVVDELDRESGQPS